MDILLAARAIGAAIVLAWLPGYAWVRVSFPDVVGIARHAIAIALSVALVVAGIYLGNVLVGWPVNGRTGASIAVAIACAALALPIARHLRARERDLAR